jgi:hypothetical protein
VGPQKKRSSRQTSRVDKHLLADCREIDFAFDWQIYCSEAGRIPEIPHKRALPSICWLDRDLGLGAKIIVSFDRTGRDQRRKLHGLTASPAWRQHGAGVNENHVRRAVAIVVRAVDS